MEPAPAPRGASPAGAGAGAGWRAWAASGARSAWPVRAAWALLPLLVGPAIGGALDGASRPVQAVASIGLWVGWAGVLVAALVPSTASLTVLRVAAPAAAAAAGAALVSGGAGTAAGVVGLAGALAVVLVALSAPTAEIFVDGSSYGDERRMPLRTPAPLLAGPVELAWLAVVAGLA
ncbi:MAG TPA: hypothetical protein VFI47_17395, partial [Acidimicrobiales bacterium]|nr:hypothetical protein [Acidimicrobiales bacterium]